MNPVVERVTERIRARSRDSRGRYLQRIDQAAAAGPTRHTLPCSNLAHATAACAGGDKESLVAGSVPNIGIVSAYNDMLSAHQPFETFPALIRAAAREAGAVAQFAGGVPAMCDGVTQGTEGMELSLFSRDVIAQATAIALSHNAFDAALCLGVCDKIVPGLLVGALSFGHLPILFLPAGPMVSGLSNKDKARVREAYAAGQASREELLRAEAAAYHGPGTCTFYGTANSNQMLMEFMGLQLPGGSFVNPNTPLRDALTVKAVQQVLELLAAGEQYLPIGRIVDERAIVNAIVGLLATGGSTNHTIHLVAVAAAAGVAINWDDFSELSAVVPQMARVYPNGQADVNHFHAAGGLGFTIGSLLDAGLLHADVLTIMGPGLDRYRQEPELTESGIRWRPAPTTSLDTTILRPADDPFAADGGLKLVQGNLGRAVVKSSAVDPAFHRIEAPARVFDSQQAFAEAFRRGEFTDDTVIVLTHQGPAANGMPELHKLMPYLGVLQSRGLRVALVTDGRLSGASGKVLAALHVVPETSVGGAIGKLQDGDLVRIDASQGLLEAVDVDFDARPPAAAGSEQTEYGTGRELFRVNRQTACDSERGGTVLAALGDRLDQD